MHAPALWGDFVWDDAIVTKRQVSAFKTVEDVFFPPKDIPQWAQNYYRPVIVASYLLDQQLFGPDATVGPHVTNLFLHVVVTFFVWLFARQSLRNLPHWRWGALFASSVFAVHPIHTESVSWITGRSDAVAAFFMVPSIVVAIYHRDHGSWWQLVLAPVLFLLAVLSKEVALSGLIVLPMILLYVPREKRPLETDGFRSLKGRPERRGNPKPGDDLKEEIRTSGRSATGTRCLVILSLLYTLATIIYFILRQKAHIGYGSSWPTDLGALVLRSWHATGYYALKTLIPYPQLHFVPMEHLPSILKASLMLVVLGTGFGIGMKYWRSGRALLIISLVWFLVTLFPSLVVAVRNISETPVAERYLYLPSISLALILGGLTCRAVERGYSKIAITVALVVIGGYGIQTGLRAAVWTDNIRLWSDATSKALEHCLPWNELAEAYYKVGDRDESLRCLEKALQTNCDAEGRSIAHNNIGTVYGHRGMWGNAESHFKAAIQERSRYASPHYGLGSVALMKSSQAKSREQVRHYAKEGVEHFGRAIRFDPHYTKAMWGLIRCHMILGKLAESRGDTVDAIKAYQIAQSQFQEMVRIDRQYAFSKPERVQILDEIQKRLDYFKRGP